MKRNREGIELDLIISVPCTQGTNRLPRTRSEVEAASRRVLRPRPQVKAAKQDGNLLLPRTCSEVEAASKRLRRPPSHVKAAKQDERYVEPPVEKSESTELPDHYCDICMEAKTKSDMFQNKSVCRHLFCSDCIGKHVESKIKENMTIVKCPYPRCKREIEPEVCKTIVSKEILNQWNKALSELEKFKCPYKGCSAMLLDNNSKKPRASSKCPKCKQPYCPRCKVVWHSGIGCKEYIMKKDEILDNQLIELAKKNKWQRCPDCGFYVERSSGCRRMECRCGCEFCYNCGRTKHYFDHEYASCRSA